MEKLKTSELDAGIQKKEKMYILDILVMPLRQVARGGVISYLWQHQCAK